VEYWRPRRTARQAGSGTERFYFTGVTITTTDKGAITEGFTSGGGQPGDKQELKRSHEIEWKRVDATPGEPTDLEIWANYYLPTNVPPENEKYFEAEYEDSVIDTRTERGTYTSTHTLTAGGRAAAGRMTASSFDETTRTVRQEVSWDYAPPEETLEEPDPQFEDGYKKYSSTGKKTKDTVSRTSTKVNEKAGYWDPPLLGRVTLGGAKTVRKTTTGNEWSESGEIDHEEVGYYNAEGHAQQVFDQIKPWGSNLPDTTTKTDTTLTVYGPGFGFDVTTTGTTGAPAPSGKVTETYNSRVFPDDQYTVVNPEIFPDPPADAVEGGPVVGPIAGGGGGTIDVDPLAAFLEWERARVGLGGGIADDLQAQAGEDLAGQLGGDLDLLDVDTLAGIHGPVVDAATTADGLTSIVVFEDGHRIIRDVPVEPPSQDLALQAIGGAEFAFYRELQRRAVRGAAVAGASVLDDAGRAGGGHADDAARLADDVPSTSHAKPWKAKIHGTAHATKTPGHKFRTLREAIKDAKNPDVERVHLNHGYNRALGLDPKTIGPNRRPDVTTIFKDGRVGRKEVKSLSDKIKDLIGRNTALDDQIIDQGFNPLRPEVVIP